MAGRGGGCLAAVVLLGLASGGAGLAGGLPGVGTAWHGNEVIISIGPPCSGKTQWLKGTVAAGGGRSATAAGAAKYPPPPRAVLDVAIDNGRTVYKSVPTREAVGMAAAACLNAMRLCDESIYDLEAHTSFGGDVRAFLRTRNYLKLLEAQERARVAGGDHAFAQGEGGAGAGAEGGSWGAGAAGVDALSSVMGGEEAIVLLCLTGHLDLPMASYLLQREVLRSEMVIANPAPSPRGDDCKKALSKHVVAIAQAAVHGLAMGLKFLRKHYGIADQETSRDREESLSVIRAPAVHVFQHLGVCYAVDDAITRLRESIEGYDGPVAWGNTNTRIKDYETALTAAFAAGRPVRFVLWGRELAPVGLHLLMMRNVVRFATTGRYIPCGAIARGKKRCERLLIETSGGDPKRFGVGIDLPERERQRLQRRKQQRPEKRLSTPGPLALDLRLAQAAGFSLDEPTRLIRGRNFLKKVPDFREKHWDS
eukprot:CAMPEP_0118867916 /NCGR_PEP_ID=MMETSP1163-20130328/11363_1 /TAXON_ID=124430 /ORGANISM="Phaeomonas parva, Strain CCMP2877" /LENGTH=479 /DNA_ID=CAMNT_0006802407 /DNA_START=107 /DNA_END=1546 /DNA_ORIENTATION=+